MGADLPSGTDRGRGVGRLPLGGLLDLIGVAAVILDSSGRIVFWSPRADEVFGYTAQEALGQRAARLDSLDQPDRPLEDTCRALLESLRHLEAHDDVALLIAHAQPLSP